MHKILAAAVAATLAATALARPFTPQDMVMLSRVSAPVVSPDGRWLVWEQRETDLNANGGVKDLWRLDLKRRAAVAEKFASTEATESDPQFGPDGTLYFLSNRKGGDVSTVWRVSMSGGAAAQVTGNYDIGGFRVSPRGDAILVWADRPVGAASLDVAQAAKSKDTGSGRVYDQLFVRHWDSWADGQRSQLFVLPLTGGKASGPGRAIAGSLIGDAPTKPFGDRDQTAWSADGRTVYFTLREAGRIEPTSTNLDVFAAAADGTSAPANVTEANKGTDTAPAVSPDGRWLAWVSMKRAGYEADRAVLWVRDLRSGEAHAVTDGWDRSVESVKWAPNSAALYITAEDTLDVPLFRVDLTTGAVHRLTGAGHVSAFDVLPDGGLVYALDSLTAPADLWRWDTSGRVTRLTSVNAARLAGIDLPTVTRFNFKGAEGDTVWGFSMRPAALAPGAKAPVAFLVHGGPQGTFNNSWSYRWNPMAWAGHGYAVVSVDFHGSTGYGQAFTDAINQNWGGRPLTDLKAGLKAATERFDYLDGENVCAAGGSYGGYMMNWIEGNWPDRFKCIVQHDGVFDARAMAYETEELWFDEWEHGGRAYFEDPAAFEKWNPVNYVEKWKTPQLVITSEKDFRIPYTQGIAAFTALQRRNVPSQLLVFPDENHWVLKPRNSLQWYRTVFGWMDRWTGNKGG